MTTIITDATKLTPNKWYALGLKNSEDEIEWGGAPIYQYVGNGCWADDNGEPIQSLWDAELQLNIDINGADEYMAQG